MRALEKLQTEIAELCMQEQRDKCRKAKAEAELAELMLAFAKENVEKAFMMPKIRGES